MRYHLLALAVLCPTAAAAQAAEQDRNWMVEVSAGLAFRDSDATARTLGRSHVVTVGRTIGPRTSWRAALEFDTWSGAFSLWAASVGFLAAETAHDRELYATGRVGLYMLADAGGLNPGGYIGVGAAIPVWRGALTLETGVQGYVYLKNTVVLYDASAFAPPPSHHKWSVPVRVGFRWLP